MNQKKRRLFTIILCIILAIVLIVPLVISVVPAAERTESQTADEDGSSGGQSDDTERAGENVSSEDAARELSGDGSARVTDGVYIENIDISGMTREEVQDAYDSKLRELSADRITLYLGDRTAQIKAGDLGLACENPEVVDDAMLIGQKGNILRRYLADKYLAENGSIVLTLELSFDEKAIRMALTGKQDEINMDPVPVTMVLNDDQTITAVDKVDGLKMQIEESAGMIREYLEKDWHGGPGAIELSGKVVPATGNIAELSEVKDMLGSNTTEYDDSETERIHNIMLAVDSISGTVLYPGEEFDFNRIVGETTEENGYMLAGSYENGDIVESYGGGICQVSTTLYGAVLEAELEVTERYPHSMTVKYVQPAFDAAIADDVKNFCFVNDQDTPVYIHGTAGGGLVRFEIYGKETRDPLRTLSFESRTISETEYTTQFVYDNEMEAGDIRSSGGRYGLQTEAWKLIYEDGEKVDEVQINDSEYIMAPLTYHIGTIGASDDYISRVDAAIQTNDADAVKSAVAGG